MGMYIQNKLQKSSKYYFTLNTIVQTQFLNISKNIPDGYKLVKPTNANIMRVKEYIDATNIVNDDACMYILNKCEKAYGIDFDVIFIATDLTGLQDTDMFKLINKDIKNEFRYRILLDVIDSLSVLIEKDNKFYIFCMYDYDNEENVNTIISSI